MSIGIYRNMFDRDIKKFGIFANEIKEKCVRNDIEIVYSIDRQLCVESLKKHNIIIIITHGDTDAMYHRYRCPIEKRMTLIDCWKVHNDPDVRTLLADSIIIAISCATTRELGKAVINDSDCTGYIGFRNNIHFNRNDGIDASDFYFNFISSCYQDVFSKTITDAINNEWSLFKFSTMLKMNALLRVTRNARELISESPNDYKKHGISYAIKAVVNVANNIETFCQMDSREVYFA